jgi:uncharacterized membrane protein
VDFRAAAADRAAAEPEDRGDVMGWMSRLRPKHGLDPERIRRAIEEAEHKTSGEIVVSVAPFFLGNVQRAADRAFDRLGISHTRERNGVLFFLVPWRRQFVVLGDEGIHQKVGQEFWEMLVQAVSRRFKEGDLTGGLVNGIDEVGRRLAVHFPYDPERDVNELPDEIC